MTWFKVDDGLAVHPKARRAGTDAMGLWVICGAWTGQNMTDGFVPAWFVESWPHGRRLAERLVNVGLWTPTSREGLAGWQFHEWNQYQPTRDQLAERRDKRAAAGRRGGIASGISRSKSEANASPVASTVVEAKPNPEPEPEPEPVPEPTTPPSLRSGGRAPKRATQVPDDFTVTAALRRWAKDNGITANLDDETIKWQDHHRFKGTTGKDWAASWRNWMKNTAAFNRGRPPVAAGHNGVIPYRDADHWEGRR